MKVVYSATYGGFGLSDKARDRYKELTGNNAPADYDIERTDIALVQVVEELGAKASGDYAHLVIRDLPKGTKYYIDEYDGSESVITIDEIRWSVAT